ncbi:MAG: pilus assembly protein [Sporichthyaceae bacterium]|nr:pilus assembly protein [Sporichthyaceae bacterium]
MSTVEVVLLTPVLVTLLLVGSALGVLVNARMDVNGAARDAARAGALERTHAAALQQARDVAAAGLDGLCASTSVTSVGGSTAFHAGGIFTVELSCRVNLSFAANVLGSTETITVQSAAPLDSLRRAG